MYTTAIAATVEKSTDLMLASNFIVTPTWLSILYTILFLVGNIVGLLGNLLVILATYDSHGTFRLDQPTLVLLRHLAISDVVFIVLYPLPMNITYPVGEWVFGKIICQVTGYFVTVPTIANINLILAISIHRYVRCRFPLSMPRLNPIRTTLLCLLIWFVSCGFFVYVAFLMQYSVAFFPYLAACSFEYPQTTGNLVMIVSVTDIPFIAIVTLNILLLQHVQKVTKKRSDRQRKRKTTRSDTEEIRTDEAEENARKNSKFKDSISKVLTLGNVRRMTQSLSRSSLNQGLITTVSVVSLFAVAWAPTVARFNYSAIKGDAAVPVWLEQIRYFYFIASWGNPVMYVTMNTGFKDYFVKFCRRICRIYCLKPTNNLSMVINSVFEDREEPSVLRRITLRDRRGPQPDAVPEGVEEVKSSEGKEGEGSKEKLKPKISFIGKNNSFPDIDNEDK